MSIVIMDNSYIAGFFDGDGSICIGKCRGGFQLKAELTQCNKLFLDSICKNLQGKIYSDKRVDKYSNEPACTLRMCGEIALPMLKLVEEYGIIKAPQAVLARKYLSHAHQQHMYNIREEYYHTMKSMNQDKESYQKNYSTLNDAYIAGLFDAEGNVYNAVCNKKHKYYVKITQKSDPTLIQHIHLYLGFGHISPSEPFRIRFYSKNDIVKFWNVVKPFIVVKKDCFEALLEQFGIFE